MQLFSRKKAIIAVSLSALTALGACGDNVTVPVAPAAPVVISITPPSASMNVGERLNFAVQISGGSTTAAPTLASCTSSNAAVATAAVAGSACAVTAVAPGNATVTAAASTGQVAAASVSVSAPTPAITSLAVSPSAAQLAVGQSVTLSPTAQPSGRTVAYTYTSSSAAIATVSATGVVAAVAPGVATITVTANGSATGFAPATISQAVTITVSDRVPGLTALTVQPSSVALALGGTQALTASVAGPRASAATLTYGTSAPAVATVSATGTITAVSAGTAVVTVTAQSVESGAFAASSVTALIPVTVSPNAQVAITNITIGSTNNPIDISNVTDQIQVNLAIQPNGQTVSEANVWVCLQGETVPACAARTGSVPAARQSFTASGSQATNINLFINTSEFASPNFATDTTANTLYKNGLRTIVATLTTSPAAASTIASNSISSVNFNNPDGWTVAWTAPANRANDVNNITYYGGPSVPDALTPSAQSGNGTFTVLPVVYTPDRWVVQAVINLSSACGSNITDRTKPYSATYGTATRDTLAGVFNCTGVATAATGMAPTVISGVDNNNNTYPGVTSTPAVARSIFDDFTNIANGTAGGFRQSLAYRRNFLYLPHDYLAPTIGAFDVRGGSDGTAAYVDSAWVNAAYFLAGTNPVTATGTGSFRYRISDGNVGLTSTNGAEFGAGAASRNTLFSVCPQAGVPATTPTAPVNCTSAVTGSVSGGISSTVASLNLPESATNATNTAYFAQVAETDRLGNRATSVVYTWANSSAGTGATRTQTRAQFDVAAGGTGGTNTGIGAVAFGVDVTAPVVATVPNSGTGSIANAVRTDRDSIFTNNGAINASNQTLASAALFAYRFSDSRSGFPVCVEATAATASQGSCRNGTPAGNVRAGTFSIQRRSASPLASVTNDAVNEAIVVTSNTSTTATNRYLNVIDAAVSGFDPAFREFTINIFGAANRVASTATLTGGTPAATVAGYYTASGSITDRAGNSTSLPTSSVAIDNANPNVTGITVPAVLAGGASVSFGPAGTDDLEAISGDLALRYPQLQYDDAVGAAVGTYPTTIRFRRVTSFNTTAALGLWHNPFAAVADNKLATPIGPGTALGSTGLVVPIPFIQQIVTVTGSAAPPTPTQIFGLFPGAADPRPNQVTAWLYDIRATSPLAFVGNGRSSALSATIFGGQVPTPSAIASTKDWGTATAGGAGIVAWQVVKVGGVDELRATTSTSITNSPFSGPVHIVRQVGTTEWEYIGTASPAGLLDQGATRFWRYTLNSTAIDQGNGVTMAALANGDVIKAVGTDAAGNGLSTAASTFGLAPAFPATVTVAATAGTAAATINDNNTGGGTRNVVVSANPNSAAITYTCVSSNPGLLTATMGGAGVCTLTAAGSAAPAGNNVTVTFTATGTVSGFNTNTISTTVVFSRQP